MNFKHLYGSSYLVYTQAGFEQALYDYMSGVSYSKSTLRNSLRGFPKSYPSVVTFTDYMFEQGAIYVSAIKLNDLIEKLKEK